MRRIALALLLASGALGCNSRETSGRARLLTLFDFARQADVGEGVPVVAGLTLPSTYFVKKTVDAAGAETGSYEVAVSSGFVDGQPMKYLTTEVWENFDKVWVQPLYIPLPIAGSKEAPHPWVFGIGPESLFYSPFWQVYRFEVPPGVDPESLLDTRAVVVAANQTGGLRKMERRITSLAPDNVGHATAPAWSENNYSANTAAWDGIGGRRYIDVGAGRFDFDENGVVREYPIFIFTKRGPDGELIQLDWPTVGGTRPLFSAAPALTNARDGGTVDEAGVPLPLPPVALTPNFGGLWRMYLVDLPEGAERMPDGRVALYGLQPCDLGTQACIVLDSQTRVESLGADRIHRTNLLASCPVLQIGGATFF